MTVAQERLIGSQVPAIHVVPPSVSSSGGEVCALADKAGLVLDPWQRLVLGDALGEREDGKWAAFETALIVPRQNGKSAVAEARMLAGLFLFGERLLIYSAHEFKTSLEIFLRMDELIAGSRNFSKRVRRISRTRGEEGFELFDGARLRFLARSNNSGRGFSGDLIILDECQNLPDGPVDAMMPSVAARPNPQIWYMGSAPDPALALCDQIARVRKRAQSGRSKALAYLEWSTELHADGCEKDCTEHDDRDSPLTWAKTNPGLGIRLEAERIALELDSMSAAGFDRERLGVGRWPQVSADSWSVIPQTAWEAVADPQIRDEDDEIVHPGSQPTDPVAFAVEVAPDRSRAAIAVAALREDGLAHIEIVHYLPGTDWVVPRLVELKAEHSPCAIALNALGPAGSLVPECEDKDLEVLKPSASEVKGACGALYDRIVPPPEKGEGWASSLRHLPHDALTAAVAAAEMKKSGSGTWQWDLAAGEAAPLSAVTLALWAHGKKAHEWTGNYDVTDSVF